MITEIFIIESLNKRQIKDKIDSKILIKVTFVFSCLLCTFQRYKLWRLHVSCMQNFVVIDVSRHRRLFLPQHRNTFFLGSSRCFAVCCSSLLQAQIEIAPRSRDGFLQLFEGRKSTRRQAGGISSSRGTGCKTLLLVSPSETRVTHRPGKWLLRRETRNIVDLSCQRETRDTIKVGRWSAPRAEIRFLSRSLHPFSYFLLIRNRRMNASFRRYLDHDLFHGLYYVSSDLIFELCFYIFTRATKCRCHIYKLKRCNDICCHT